MCMMSALSKQAARSRHVLRPGMVITVEPGLYIPNDDDIPRALRGMGVRIEDDILITPSGPASFKRGRA